MNDNEPKLPPAGGGVLTGGERPSVFVHPPEKRGAESTAPRGGLVSRPILRRALTDSVRKLDPRVQFRNPVMFVVLAGSALSTLVFAARLVTGRTDHAVFGALVILFLWATVLFANFAEALAEGRGKAQAAALRAARTDTVARVRRPDGATEAVPATELTVGDECVVTAGEVIPGDGEVVEGIASVDESAITGESAPVIRESGGDRSAVTGGTTVLSDAIVVRVTARPGETFLDRMIALVEGAERRKTPNEIALNILLGGLTLVFLVAVVTLQPLAVYSQARQDTIVLVALLVCLIPTTIGALLSAIGIAGMDRLVRRNVLATSGRAVEASGDVTTLLLDKTGTITLGNRQAAELLPLPGVPLEDLVTAAYRSSIADGTPEGRSIVDFALADRPHLRGRYDGRGTMVPFTAETRMSGLDDGGHTVRKGATDAVARWVRERGGEVPDALGRLAAEVADAGGTPLAVAEARGAGREPRPLGVIHLKDTVKPGMRERFEQLRAMGIRTVMVTGDNPRTAAVIAEEAGVDDVLAEATPEQKLALIRREQAGGALVAMTGDGTNDAPALAQADVGVAMSTGTQAAREAGNMVDLDSDPTKLIEIVRIGKQLLITRGALTTFSIANDVAKYFAVIPAMFAASLPGLERLDVMGLASAESAILSAVVFNALVIVALVPLSLRGVRFRARSASATLRRNLLVYGLGGLVAPFAGIKLIDTVVSSLGVL
ncbi:potassium-transporting ATPase subunit KdpB [Nocardiopsis sp. NPDC050513]|uniref:potassium-transporting ATPase subunit KdpB n=1 Tax=Nocardiopsis sp. NPDC050513 TaxID=3364338 RepID=UPI00379B744D